MNASADTFTPEEIERFKTDPDFYKHFRRTMENNMNVSRCVPPFLPAAAR